MPIIYQKIIKRADLRANPDVLYVFGDNLARVGMGGQAAEMRGEPNAVGIPTKKSPYEYMTDAEYPNNCLEISRAFIRIIPHLTEDGIVVFPIDGIGTGLAKLQEKAPETWAWLDGINKDMYNKYA